jgi:uncharacterized protein (TIGR02118 family)
MPVKLIVLYPHPVDVDAFERRYHGDHLPLMRRLIGPGVPLLTHLTVGPPDRPWYRVAEIHFDDMAHFTRFLQSDPQGTGRASAEKVSTGGPPVFVVCEEQKGGREGTRGGAPLDLACARQDTASRQ